MERLAERKAPKETQREKSNGKMTLELESTRMNDCISIGIWFDTDADEWLGKMTQMIFQISDPGG